VLSRLSRLGRVARFLLWSPIRESVASPTGFEAARARIRTWSLIASRQKFRVLPMNPTAPDAASRRMTVDVMASRCEATTLHENPEAGALDGGAVPVGGMNVLRQSLEAELTWVPEPEL